MAATIHSGLDNDSDYAGAIRNAAATARKILAAVEAEGAER